MSKQPKVSLRVALAGNPNTGKTSLFNALTGGHQHVGNYSGVTIERRDGRRTIGGHAAIIHDLPGAYSLNSWSPEERIAQDELLNNTPDVAVVVTNATQLSRGLVLLAQVMQTGVRTVLCLNMSDEAKALGQRVDVAQMSALLAMPVVETVGHRALGIEALDAAILQAAKAPPPIERLVLGERMDHALAEVCATLPKTTQTRWTATRLLLDEANLEASDEAKAAAAQAREKIEQETGEDIQLFITQRYFGFVDGLLKEVMRRSAQVDTRAVSDKIDKILVNKTLGLPIFAVIMYLIFWLTFSLGEAPMGWIESGFGWLSTFISSHLSEGPLQGLLVDGVIGGVGGVIVFLPNIVLLFLGLSLLEDSGYLARAAFLMDATFHRFGLHGKSFIPMMTGFGCTIPAIMATRTLENERDRLTTMMVLPLMSCGARLPIWLLLVPALFPPAWRAPMLWLIYASGVALALVLAKLLRRSLLKGEEAPFVMELPPYRVPTLKAVIGRMVERSNMYLVKAGTTILAISVLMWAATTYPKAEPFEPPTVQISAEATLAAEQQHLADALAHSYAGQVGRAMEPIFAPLGFDWKINTALLGAFAAKEVFVAQMGIVNAVGEVDETDDSLRSTLAASYSPLVGLSLILFLLIATPCMATVVITRKESGSWKWAGVQFFGLTGIAYLISLVVYQVGRFVT